MISILNNNKTQQFIKNNNIKNENIDNFLNELIENYIPREYKMKIKDKNINELTTNDNNKEHENKNYFNYKNCIILNEKLFSILYNNKDQYTMNKKEIKYLIGNKILIIIDNDNIKIGTLNKENIFQNEKIIKYENKEKLDSILNEIKNNNNEEKNNHKQNNINNFNNDDIKINKNDDIKHNLNIINDRNENRDENKNCFISNSSNTIKNQKKEINDSQIQNIKQHEINKYLINMIAILIDSEKLKKKMLNNFGQNKNIYYLLNYNWFKKYIELNNLNEIYEFLKNNKIIENKVKNNNINNKILLYDILSNINQNLIGKIKKKINYDTILNNDYYCETQKLHINEENKNLTLYYNCLLITNETQNSLKKEFSIETDYFFVFNLDEKIIK